MRKKEEIMEELKQVNIKNTKINMFTAQEYADYKRTKNNTILDKLNSLTQEAGYLFEKIQLLDKELNEATE